MVRRGSLEWWRGSALPPRSSGGTLPPRSSGSTKNEQTTLCTHATLALYQPVLDLRD